MPEPYERCAHPNCGATLAAHRDPEIVTCSSFAAIDPDPIHTARCEGAADGEAERAQLSARLVEANEALELWGAFDYELELMAERSGLSTAGLSPLDVVRALVMHERHMARFEAERGRA